MTAVPVVSATLTTRTVREALSTDGDWFPADDIVWAASAANERRERLTVDPVFVVVDAAPDLTCRFCKGTGFWPDNYYCAPCGGSGVSPVYAATWQEFCPVCGTAMDEHPNNEEGCWYVDLSECAYYQWQHKGGERGTCSFGCRDEPECVTCGPFDPYERRQVVEWRATDVTVLPVVNPWRVGPDGHCVGDDPCIALSNDPDSDRVWFLSGYSRDPLGYEHATFKDGEPWAADLQPGQFVVRLSGWEHLDTPLTEMVCQGCDNDPGRIALRDLEPIHIVPLSVPDGAVTWIDLA